jgi:hypothetical protein
MKHSLFFILVCGALALAVSGCAVERHTQKGSLAGSLGTDRGVKYTKRNPDGSFTSIILDENQSTGLGKAVGGFIADQLSGNLDTGIGAAENVLKNRDALKGANEGARIAGQNTVNEIEANTARAVAVSPE